MDYEEINETKEKTYCLPVICSKVSIFKDKEIT